MRKTIIQIWKPVAGALFLLAIAGIWLGLAGSETSGTGGEIVTLVESNDADATRESKERWGVHINAPTGPPSVATGLIDVDGNPVTINCSACHATREPNFDTRRGEELDIFHQGLTMQHGDLTCLSCHNAGDYQTLRAADGRAIPFENSMQLCAQCHGPQYRDYQHGAHGGMMGYWSLEHGPRSRNSCLDCHDPHAPQFVGMHPEPPPLDRFLVPGGQPLELDEVTPMGEQP